MSCDTNKQGSVVMLYFVNKCQLFFTVLTLAAFKFMILKKLGYFSVLTSKQLIYAFY